MRGKSTYKKIAIEADPMYGNMILAKFINNVMRDGKKTTAQRAIYDAFEKIKEQGHEDPLQVFLTAIDEVAPRMEVKARRIGGAAYQVPTEVRGSRKVSLAMRWIIEASRKRPTAEFKTYADKLAAELIAATKGEGEAIRKKEGAHKMAEANKAFAHFRF